MLDSDFKIERIAWYQSKGLHLLNSDSDDEKESITDPGEKKSIEQTNGVATKMGSVSSRLSKIFRAGHLAKHHSEVPRTRNHSNPLLEPLSTATSPLDGPTDTDQLHDREEVLQNRAHADESEIPEKNKWGADVIKPTFYIENSQTRLKLVARSEVRLCILFTQYSVNCQLLVHLASNVTMDIYAGKGRRYLPPHQQQQV